MATHKLTTKFCDNAPEGTHFDGEGMYLLVEPSGKKYWRMSCRLHGKKKLLSFKSYPQVSLAEARKLRNEAKKLILQGIDPIQHAKDKRLKSLRTREKEALASQNTFKQIAERLIEHKRNTKAAGEEYCNRMLNMLENHVFPIIGNKPIEDIESTELLALFKAIAEKENHGCKMTYSALKLCQWCAETFDYAHIENNAFFKNPCRIVIKYLPRHKYKHMARIDFQVLPDFIQKLEDYKGYIVTRAAIWIMLYTGVRQKSIRYAKIQDFDLENNIWHRQPEKVKQADMGLAENVLKLPLPVQAVKLLEEVLGFTAGINEDLMFPSRYNLYDRMSEATIGKAIKLMKFEMVGHGLRAVVRTGLGELGYRKEIIEMQIGHKLPPIEAAYNDSTYYDERVQMMQAWADYLDTFKNNKSSFNSAL